MKFGEYLRKRKEVSLIGKLINDKFVTEKTKNEVWYDKFDCSDEGLTTLKGAPKKVSGDFRCDHNLLTSLEGAPERVDGDFDCYRNSLTTLRGAPTYVGREFACYKNGLLSIDGAPKEIGGNFDCSFNQLTSLKDVHKKITKIKGIVNFRDNPIMSHVLGLLLIPGITDVSSSGQWGPILTEYLGKGRKGLLDCQNELIEAGLEEYAQL